MKLRTSHSFGCALALAAASALVLGGCGKAEEKGPMEQAGAAADKAIKKVRTASTDAAKSVSEAAEKAKVGASEMTATAGAAMEKAGKKVAAAGEKSAQEAKTAVAATPAPKK